MINEFKNEIPALWLAEEVACVTDSTMKSRWSVHGVATDLDRLVPGDLFISARGDVEAHKALSMGAGAIVSETYAKGATTLVVKNCLQAFIDLAQGARHRARSVFIGVAGEDEDVIATQSEMAAILSSYGMVYAPVVEDVSLKNIMLCLANMPRDVDFVILPVPFEEASWMVKPDIVVVRDGYDEGLNGDIFAGMNAQGVLICGNKQDRREVYQAMARTQGITKQYEYFSRDGLRSACAMTMVQALSVAQRLPICPFYDAPKPREEDHISHVLDLRPQRAANDAFKRHG